MFGKNRTIALMKGKIKYALPRHNTKPHTNNYTNQNYNNFQPTQPIQIKLDDLIITIITLLIIGLILYLWFFTNY